MAKQATVKVHFWRTNHKGNDVWKAAVDRPGNGGVSYLKGNYTRQATAKRGGLRGVRAENINGVWSCMIGAKRYFIDFITVKPAK